MKYAFINAPGYGHINPTLAVVQELVTRGEEVIYFTPEQFKATIEATGARQYSYESDFSGMAAPGRQMNPNSALPYRMIGETRKVLPQILDYLHAEQPDFIVYDSLTLWGRITARLLNIPAISFRPTYASNQHFNFRDMMRSSHMGAMFNPAAMMASMKEGLEQLCSEYNIPLITPQDMFLHAEDLNIVFLPRAFQPAGDTFDERFVFVGPSIAPRHESYEFSLEQLQADKPLLYISLGTVFNNRADFFKMCFEAFSNLPWQVVLAKGKHVDISELGPVPANFIVAPYVPQLEILPHTRVFISHGGMNSTMESLYNGVPIVAVPQMMEQAMTAKRLQDLDLGIALNPEEINAQILRDAVEKINNDPGYYQRVQEMQRHTHEAGGYKRAVDEIIKFSQTHSQQSTAQA